MQTQKSDQMRHLHRQNSAGAQSGQHEHGEQKCCKFVVFHDCLLKNFMLFSSFIYIDSNYPKNRTAFFEKILFFLLPTDGNISITYNLTVLVNDLLIEPISAFCTSQRRGLCE